MGESARESKRKWKKRLEAGKIQSGEEPGQF